MKTVSPILLKLGIVLSAVLIYVGLFFCTPLLAEYCVSLLGIDEDVFILLYYFFPLSIWHAIATALCFIGLPSSKYKTFSSISTAALISFLFSPAFIFFFSKTMFIRFHLIEPKEESNNTSHRKGLYFVGYSLGMAIFWGLITLLAVVTAAPGDGTIVGFTFSNFGLIMGLTFFFLINVAYALWKRKITKSFTIVLGIVTGYLTWGIIAFITLPGLFRLFLIYLTAPGIG